MTDAASCPGAEGACEWRGELSIAKKWRCTGVAGTCKCLCPTCHPRRREQ